MAKMSTPDISAVDMQTMLDHGLNAFGLVCLVESYASADRPAPPPITLLFRGVWVSLCPASDVATRADDIDDRRDACDSIAALHKLERYFQQSGHGAAFLEIVEALRPLAYRASGQTTSDEDKPL
jgi:hypothetical protein